MKIIAYRGGNREGLENNKETFKKIFMEHPDCILDIDIQFTQDGMGILEHDPVLIDDTSRKVRIKNFTLQNLLTKKFMRKQEEYFQDSVLTGIYTMEEFLKDFPNCHLHLGINAESKDHALELLKSVSKYRKGMITYITAPSRLQPVLMKSFPDFLWGATKEEILQLLIAHFLKKKNPPKIVSKVLMVPKRSGIFKIIEPWFMEWSKILNIPVWAWVIDDPIEVKRLVSLGVEAIFTSRPRYLIQEILNI